MRKDISKVVATIHEIRNRLLQDESIRQLLVYDSSDALEREVPTLEGTKDYISLVPVIEEGIVTTDRSQCIALDLASIDMQFEANDTALYGTMAVSVLCSDKTLLLDNNKFRHWELARLVINDLEDMKGSASGKIEVVSVDRFINKHYYGCAVKLVITDDATEMSF